MTSMLIDYCPFKKIGQKRLFEHTEFRNSFSMNFKRLNSGTISPKDCREMKVVEPSLTDDPDSTNKSQFSATSARNPPPKMRKGIEVFRHFPNSNIQEGQNHVSFHGSDVDDIQEIDSFSNESTEGVQIEVNNLVHPELPSQLSTNYELLGAKDQSRNWSIVSFDDYQSMVSRLKVREVLNIFKELYKILSNQDTSKSKKKGNNSWKINSEATALLKHHKKWVNVDEILIGVVPGVVVGDCFQFRVELVIIGLHRQYNAGIDYVNIDGMVFATSIVSSGRYANDTKLSDSLIYSGQGGNPKTGSKEFEDQKLERGNLALKNSMDAGTPVRVIRGYNIWKSSSGKKGSSKIYVYDGLYVVTKFWQERGEYGKLVFKFQLNRMTDQPHKPTKPIIEAKSDHCIVEDISQGKEKIPIRVINDIDDEKPPPFTYITNMKYPKFCTSYTPRSCNCKDGCSDLVQCSCVVKNGGEVPFNDNGDIVKAKSIIYECGPFCKCPPSCENRVSQRGIRYELEVFKTKKSGWGVRSRNLIPSGGFICEYIGEVLGDNEADDRAGRDEYLFDIGNNYNNYAFGYGKDSSKRVKDNDFAIDAAHLGNIGRFINHSCSPNMYAQNVFYDHDDRRLPHIMLFATKKIKPLQELTYDYNYKIDQVYDANGNIKRKDCYCGARCCTGRMY